MILLSWNINGIRAGDKKNRKPFKQGDVFFVPPMEWHQFVNKNDKPLKILCLIPYK